MTLALSRGDASSIIDRPDYVRYNGANVSVGANTSILADTAAKNYAILSIILTGDGDGEFTIFLNSNEILRVRNSWSMKGQTFPLDGQQIDAGDIIQIFCKNTSRAS